MRTKKMDIQIKNKGFITIPSVTAHKLFKMGASGVDALTLYNFLQYTALWQNDEHGINNRPFATRNYCKKALHWGTDRYVVASKILRIEGLKKVRLNTESGVVKGRYVELPFVNNSEKTSTEVITRNDLPTEMTLGGSPNTDVKDSLNTDSKDIPAINISKTATVKATSSIEFLRTPPVDYVESLSSELEVPQEFIEKERVKCLDWFESKGKRMKNYNAFFRNWIRRAWESVPDWKKDGSNSFEKVPDGMRFSIEKQKDVWYEGGKIIAEYEDDLQWQAFLKTKGENFVIPKKPADGVGYQPMSHEERMKKIESGEIKVWDF